MISKRAQAVDTSGIRRVFELASKLENPINLSIGQPDFGAFPEVKEAAKAAIDQEKSSYTVSQGIPELRGKLREKLGISSADQDVLVTAGVSGGLLLSYLSLLDPGDEILMPDPFFCIYRDLAYMVNAVPSYYSIYPDFRLSAERIESAITPRTKAIIVNTPANPTGYACSQEELDEVVALAKIHDLYVLYDEIYDVFCFDTPHPQCLHSYDKAIALNGFSKSAGVPGWRLGFVAAERSLIDTMIKLQQYTIVCANSIGQWAILEALDYDFSTLLENYRAKRDFIVSALADKFEFVEPGGAFYVFPKAPGGSGQAFVERCIEKKLLVVPGHVFSREDSHFRISFSADLKVLEQGVEILRSLV